MSNMSLDELADLKHMLDEAHYLIALVRHRGVFQTEASRKALSTAFMRVW
jgi:hypothetical protein